MAKILATVLSVLLIVSCSTNKKLHSEKEIASGNAMPACLQTIIKSMAAEPNGSPQSVSSYTYKDQTVYYFVSPCCDKYNVVYDTNCNILGYPDGGITGKGDGKMINFKSESSNKKIIWLQDSSSKPSN